MATDASFASRAPAETCDGNARRGPIFISLVTYVFLSWSSRGGQDADRLSGISPFDRTCRDERDSRGSGGRRVTAVTRTEPCLVCGTMHLPRPCRMPQQKTR